LPQRIVRIETVLRFRIAAVSEVGLIYGRGRSLEALAAGKFPVNQKSNHLRSVEVAPDVALAYLV